MTHTHRTENDTGAAPAGRLSSAARIPARAPSTAAGLPSSVARIPSSAVRAPSTAAGAPGVRRWDVSAVRALQRAAGNAALNAMLAPPVQRALGYDEMHDDPAGPSVRFRGPRRSNTGDKAAAKVRDPARWNTAAASYQQITGAAPVKERVTFGTDYRTAQEQAPGAAMTTLAGAVYADANTTLISQGQLPMAMNNDAFFEQLGRADQRTLPYWQQQDRRDEGIIEDAVTREGQYRATGGPAAAAATRTAAGAALANPQPADAAATGLLQNFQGLAVGGEHGNEKFFDWAVTNMAALHAGGVNTIYTEALRDDAYQALVDDYLSTPTAPMDPRLGNFLAKYQAGHGVNLRAFLDAARIAGVRVRAMSGRPARLVAGDAHRRAAALNTYAEQVITQDQTANPGGYLVQVGEAHLGEHTNPAGAPVTVGASTLPDQFPGLDQLLGIPGAKLADMAGGGLQLELV